MAYYGTTAATTLRNPPRLISAPGLYGQQATSGLTTSPDSPNNQGGQIWAYCSTNKTTDIVVAGFFSDGADLGMRPGDWVFATQFTSAGSTVVGSIHMVTVVNSTARTASVGAVTGALLSTTRATSL